MKTAISIPDSLFEAAERLAGRMGLSRSQLYQRAVQSFLRAHDQEGVTETLNEVYADEPTDDRLDPVLEQLQESSLPKDQWS
jgi:metal-responsive CopG/Arc/MetJ family transcriptional regulator